MKLLARTYMPFTLGVAVMLAASCARHAEFRFAQTPTSHEPGTIARVERIGGHSATTLRFLLWWADLPERVRVEHGVSLYRIEYWTRNYDGSPTIASGLFAVPRKAALQGVVSYQHGTNPTRALTPSKPTLSEGVLASAVFAGGGYLLVAPDYIGLGSSQELHPYLHTPSTTDAVIDMLRASRILCEHLGVQCPDSIYLTGFSQGGHATVATLKKLEKLEDPRLRVVAAAAVAAPCDLDGRAFPFALNTHGTFYLAYLTNAYCRVYGHPIESVLAAPYSEQVPELFDGNHTPDEILSALPQNARDIFSKEFLQSYDSGQPTWLLTAIAENAVEPWPCTVPLRLYYGTGDVDVSPAEAPAFARGVTESGGHATPICVGDYDHNGSVVHAVPRIRQWFDELSEPMHSR